mgnify:CR=1 FL=1
MHSGFWPPHLQSCRLNLQKILRAAPIQNCEGKQLGSWGYVGKKPSSHFWLTCFPTQTLLSGVELRKRAFDDELKTQGVWRKSHFESLLSEAQSRWVDASCYRQKGFFIVEFEG